MSEKKKIEVIEPTPLNDEEDALVMGYKSGAFEQDAGMFYAPFNPFVMTERDELQYEIEMIEDEREQKERKKSRRRNHRLSSKT